MKSDINTLIDLKNSLDDENVSKEVESAKISNPAKEIEDSLVSFVTGRLARLEQDAQFADLIKMHLRGRFPEMTIDQLIQLNDQVTKNNNRGVEGMMPIFQGDQSGKIITDHLKDNSTATTAQKLYDKADKDMLQALGYLSSVIAKAGTVNNVVPGEIIEEKDN